MTSRGRLTYKLMAEGVMVQATLDCKIHRRLAYVHQGKGEIPTISFTI